MDKYYTKPCNFYFGKQSEKKVLKNQSLPLCGSKFISFDSIEIISRKNNKLLHFKKINNLNKNLRKKINFDIWKYCKKKKI
jgi:hypothetical protein